MSITDGKTLYKWATDLFPICRSLSGNGVRETLAFIKELVPQLQVHQINSGTEVFDWKVPQEWNIRDAYILDESGKKIVDFKENNLHVVGYSEPVDMYLTLEELQAHIHSIPEQPNAIPYITSYYSRTWGFCMTDEQRQSLSPGRYRVVIDSELKDGVLNYADVVLKGASQKEVLVSTYVCHPSMGNNEVSGPVVATALARWISSIENRYFTYRFVFIPETIGSIIYLNEHLAHLRENVVAGFNVSCVGDNLGYSFMPSRAEDSLADRAARHTIGKIDPNYSLYSWLDRGSDERQYCAPGIDLPVTSLMRSKYGEYPEYHTSLDDLSFISAEGLQGGLTMIIKAVEAIEKNCFPRVTVFGEPQLGKRGLYPQVSTKGSKDSARTIMNLLTYADGRRDLIAIADKINVPVWELYPIIDSLSSHGLLECYREKS